MVNQSTGVMEQKVALSQMIEKIGNDMKNWDRKYVVEFIPNSKHHNGKNMLLIRGDDSDVSCLNIEISEEGIFPYIFDDSVS